MPPGPPNSSGAAGHRADDPATGAGLLLVSGEQRSNPELENPNPKEIRNEKSEGRAGGWPISVFGLRISFGFRIWADTNRL